MLCLQLSENVSHILKFAIFEIVPLKCGIADTVLAIKKLFVCQQIVKNIRMP